MQTQITVPIFNVTFLTKMSGLWDIWPIPWGTAEVLVIIYDYYFVNTQCWQRDDCHCWGCLWWYWRDSLPHGHTGTLLGIMSRKYTVSLRERWEESLVITPMMFQPPWDWGTSQCCPATGKTRSPRLIWSRRKR